MSKMTNERIDIVIKVSIILLLATALVFVVMSVSLSAFADRSDCRDGKYFINDRPVLVDGEQVLCKRLRLGR